MSYCSVNGEENNQLSVFDRGLAYGDGFFTTAKVAQGKVCFIDAHLQRLTQAQQRLQFLPLNIELIEAEMHKAAQSIKQGVLKVLISAGAGGRGYSRDNSTTAVSVVSTSQLPEHYPQWRKQGVRLGISKIALGLNPLTAGLKHLNRLEQVLVKQDLAQQENVDELIVADIQQQIVEVSAANVFLIKDDKIFTPNLAYAGVDGIIRQQLLANCEQIQVTDCSVSFLEEVDEVFITNALMGVVPVATLNGRQLKISKSRHYQKLISKMELDSITC